MRKRTALKIFARAQQGGPRAPSAAAVAKALRAFGLDEWPMCECCNPPNRLTFVEHVREGTPAWEQWKDVPVLGR